MTFTIKPRPRNDGVTLASDALSYPMWYRQTEHAIGYAKFRAGNQSARIDVLDASGAIMETIEHDPTRRDTVAEGRLPEKCFKTTNRLVMNAKRTAQGDY
jgi:hypothetical protein